MYKKNFILVLITLSIYSCNKSVSFKDPNFFLFIKDILEIKKIESEIREKLPNKEVMKDYGITILYGNDTKCTEDLGVWGQTTGEEKCIVTGKTTKIEYVKEIIKIYIDKMKANGIDIVPVVKSNSPYLLMFDTLEDKKETLKERSVENESILRKKQDLQANETFVIKDSKEGFSSNAKERNAAPEEIIHLLHNYGISETVPEWQDKLNTETNDALNQKKLNWEDKNDDKIGDNTDDENGGLPKSDLDDEILSNGIEAYFKIRGENGYIKNKVICISRQCGSKNSNQMLKDNLPVLYNLIKKLLGSDTSFYP